MKRKETSYANQAAHADPLFLWYLMGAIRAKDEDFLEATALEFMEEFDFDKLDAKEAQKNNDLHLTNPFA